MHAPVVVSVCTRMGDGQDGTCNICSWVMFSHLDLVHIHLSDDVYTIYSKFAHHTLSPTSATVNWRRPRSWSARRVHRMTNITY